MKITEAELKIVLEKHALWLRNDPNGVRANLCGANLSEANLYRANLYGADLYMTNLYGANLSKANLYGANLSEANLYRANLSEASLYGADLYMTNLYMTNLYGANLSKANLYGANLSKANLYGANLNEANLFRANLYRANLSEANLYRANLYRANLYGAMNVNVPLMCPEKGSFTGFKKVRGNYIVELEILADAMRSSATGRKCRCSKAKVVSITNPDGSKAEETSACSGWDPNFIYSVGEVVEVKDFDTNRWNECAPGIHFFITRQEAIDYIL